MLHSSKQVLVISVAGVAHEMLVAPGTTLSFGFSLGNDIRFEREGDGAQETIFLLMILPEGRVRVTPLEFEAVLLGGVPVGPGVQQLPLTVSLPAVDGLEVSLARRELEGEDGGARMDIGNPAEVLLDGPADPPCQEPQHLDVPQPAPGASALRPPRSPILLMLAGVVAALALTGGFYFYQTLVRSNTGTETVQHAESDPFSPPELPPDQLFAEGLKYEEGHDVSPDLAKAAQYYRKAAEAGSVDAMNSLAILFMNGNGVNADAKQAAALFASASAKGSAKAAFNLGLCQMNGIGVPVDLPAAAKSFTQAAMRNNTAAMVELAALHASGRGVPRDLPKAVELYERAANSGSQDAMIALGRLYITGQGVPADSAKGISWLEKASTKGSAAAMEELGRVYVNGEGVSANAEVARRWYEKAVSAGSDTARTKLEQISGAEKLTGSDGAGSTVLDFQEAKSRAAGGDHYAEAVLGGYYYLGYKTPKDLAMAAEYALKSAEAGNPLGCYYVGCMRMNGEGMARNVTQGLALKTKSLEGLDRMVNDPYALAALGAMYAAGEVVPRDEARAAKLLKAAANMGYNPHAREELGDKPAAFDSLRRKPEQGSARGQASHTKVVLIGDSLSVGRFGQIMRGLLLQRFGQDGVCIYAACGSSPKDWLSESKEFVTHCGYRRYDSRGSLLFDYANGVAPRRVTTPKLSHIFSRYQPALVLVQLGAHWLEPLEAGSISAESCRSIVSAFISEIRANCAQQTRIAWMTPARSWEHPKASAILERVLNESALDLNFLAIDTQVILGERQMNLASDGRFVLSTQASQLLARGVMSVVAPSPPSGVRDGAGLSPGADLEIIDASLSEEDGGQIKSLRFTVRSRGPAPVDLSLGALRIDVIFYEKFDGEIVVARSPAGSIWHKWSTAPVDWRDGPETLKVNYAQPSAGKGKAPKFYGYMVNIYYHGRLLETWAEPARLKELFPLAPMRSEDDSNSSAGGDERHTLAESADPSSLCRASFEGYPAHIHSFRN